ncbi:MAG: hypothetical protein ACYC2U_08235 [Candidatus Amoebophilus sp.]
MIGEYEYEELIELIANQMARRGVCVSLDTIRYILELGNASQDNINEVIKIAKQTGAAEEKKRLMIKVQAQKAVINNDQLYRGEDIQEGYLKALRWVEEKLR